MKNKALPWILLFLPISLSAVEPEEVIEDFFDNLEAGSYSRAIDYFFTGNKRMTPSHLEGMKGNLDKHLGGGGAVLWA